MAINSDILRGHTETIILRRLDESDSYGYEISKAIFDLSDGALDLKDATIYTAFRRMEQEELIVSYWGDGDLGARRRYYAITDKGRTVLSQHVSDWKQTIETLNKLIIGGSNND